MCRSVNGVVSQLAGQRPLCTVIVPTYNRSGLLRHTLDALVRQTLGTGQFEVIVVDDGSSDDTAAVVAGYSGRLNVSYYFQPDEGYRLAAARNLGVRHARGPICVFVDSGVVLHSGALDAYLRAHQQAAQPVAVIGYAYCFNENNEDGEEILAEIDFGNPDATMASLGAHAAAPGGSSFDGVRGPHFAPGAEHAMLMTRPALS